MIGNAYSSTWNSFQDLERMFDQMTRIIDGGRSRADGGPAANLWAGDDTLAITAEVPGIDPASIHVSLEGDAVTIVGKHQPSTADGARQWHRRERTLGDFARTVHLPYPVDGDRTEARVRDGVLTLVLHRSAADKPRRIAVQAA